MDELEVVLAVYRDAFGVRSDKANETHKAACIEVARLQAIEEAAQEVLGCFVVTDFWDDEAGTPAREGRVGDMTRDKKLEVLAALLESK